MCTFNIRFAVKEDNHVIFSLIRQLAEYEKMAQDCVLEEEVLYDSLFNKKSAEALIGEADGRVVGYALFFSNFSTFLGKAGIYIEDIFVLPEYRGRGLGKRFFRFIASIALARRCARVEWACLGWNKPSRSFYEGLGAVPKEEWVPYRLEGEQILKLAQEQRLPG
ncbi:MAG: GNAT family N-acetyltransferase [Clostridia bacterium]|nr:GNAT family N-acetyltransferase [Clostridia bacterium]MDR3644257.1 GNAT family N-acetyltransferase [Clostridia bacterium]